MEKYKYLIIQDLKLNELNILSKNDMVVNRYMSEIERVNEDPDFHQYMSWEEDQRKIQNSLREEYREEGLAEGRAEGRVEGRVEGIHLAKLEDAKKMKEENIDNSTIAKITGLTQEEIENL